MPARTGPNPETSMSRAIPRLPFAHLRADIAAALAPKVERLGYLGEFFAATAHQPDALAAFIAFTEHAKGELDMRLVELIALTVASLKQVAYERNQHERLAVKLGYGRDWVAAVEALAPDPALLTPRECLVQRYVIAAVLRDGRDCGDLLDEVAADLGAAGAIAVLMVLARYTAHALMVNSLAIAAPVPSIFDAAAAG